MKDSSFTEQERADGVTETVSVEVTPIEYDLLDAFRALGKKKGAAAQDIIIQVILTMSDINNVNS